MKKLEITSIEKYKYLLKDEENKIYSIGLEFHDIENPIIGNYIYMNEKLLNKKYDGYSEFYAFGPLDGIYGRTIKSEEDEDLIIIDTQEERIYLKRYYG